MSKCSCFRNNTESKRSFAPLAIQNDKIIEEKKIENVEKTGSIKMNKANFEEKKHAKPQKKSKTEH